MRIGQTEAEHDEGWIIVKNLPFACPTPKHYNALSVANTACFRYTADAAAVSEFFQRPHGCAVKVESFSPVKKGAMNTGN